MILETKSTRVLDFGFVSACFVASILWTVAGIYMSDINVSVSTLTFPKITFSKIKIKIYFPHISNIVWCLYYQMHFKTFT